MSVENLIRKFRYLAVFIFMLSFCSCASLYYQYPPVTIEEIIKLSKEKIPPDQIIDKIEQSQTIYRLSADEIVEMKKAGVDSKIIDYMLRTHEEAIRKEQELQDWRNWYFYYGHYYWSPYFYSPYRWGPYPYPRFYP